MHPQIEAIFDDANSRYLKVEELKLVAQYVGSIPVRLEAYRSLRNHDLEIMQWVADQLQAEMPHEKTENLERSIKTALLMLRHCGMSMLLNEDTIIKEQFLNWVVPMVEVYDTQAIDSRLYQLLNQRLDQVLDKHMAYLSPRLLMAQNALLPQHAEPAIGAAIGR